LLLIVSLIIQPQKALQKQPRIVEWTATPCSNWVGGFCTENLQHHRRR
jgi:hypothetical protein